MKKRHVNILFAFIITAILFSSYGCIPRKVRKEAEANKEKYEEAFIQKVEEEFGTDCVLSDVKGEIHWETWDFQWPGYEAGDYLIGKLEYNGEVYDLDYNYWSGNIYTEAFHRAIIDDLAYTIGLDSSKITYGCLFDGDFKHPKLDSEIRTASQLLKSDKYSNYWQFYIVTDEDISDIKYFDYTPMLSKMNGYYNVSVFVFSSDDLANLDHFKEHCIESSIWYDENRHPVITENGEQKDVFDIYNLKGLAMVSYCNGNMSVMNYK